MRSKTNMGSIVRAIFILIIVVFGFILLIKMNIIDAYRFWNPEIVGNCVTVTIVCNKTMTKKCEAVANSLNQLGIRTQVFNMIPYTIKSDVLIIYDKPVISNLELVKLKEYASQGGVLVLADGSGIATKEKKKIVYVGLGELQVMKSGKNPDLGFDYVVNQSGNSSKPEIIKVNNLTIVNVELFRFCRGVYKLHQKIYDYTVFGTNLEEYGILNTTDGQKPAITIQTYGKGFIVFAPFDIFMNGDSCLISGIIRRTCANQFLLCKLGLA